MAKKWLVLSQDQELSRYHITGTGLMLIPAIAVHDHETADIFSSRNELMWFTPQDLSSKVKRTTPDSKEIA